MLRFSHPINLPAIALVIAALTYTAALCFVNTHASRVSNDLIAIVDGAIVLSALGMAMLAPRRGLWIMLLALAVNFLLIALLANEFNLKAVRDPLVLIAFVALGQRFGGARMAQTAFLVASAIVVPIALLELLAPALYTQIFDVLRYYMGRGLVSAEEAQYQTSAFFISGERGDGRFLTSFFGAHRASSVFLEPVSMGNFGALAAAFALSLEPRRWRLAAALGAVAAFSIIASDARFAATVVVLFALSRFLPTKWTVLALAPLPLVAVAILIGVSYAAPEVGDNFLSRLSLSGRLLTEFDLDQLFGLAPNSLTTVDSGYAYALASLGLPMCVLLWGAFVGIPTPSREAARYKLMLGVYACALLCISGSSLFALKTAGLGWFALGALAGLQTESRRVMGRAVTRTAPA
ncbi:MAG TPA: hypothetical protein VEA80_01265 [Vitreimonas sp.]|uniref:hypothetical protein n=1 Tax=Vitreimonas sp. TaxID=3069702 RepID=UPI002D4273A7|nr:hypothetical protein [Vitreimonas sp.]HYD86080.1 hypothetical protein [Vitreimonas sp.]